MTRHERFCPECGALLGNKRSLPDHRRFFAMLKPAFKQWPEGDFAPTSIHHFRSWLLVQAGHSDVAYVSTIQEAVTAAVGKDNYAYAQPVGAQIEVIKAKSLSFAALDQKAFGQIREKVEDIIEANIGVPVDQLLRERAA